MLSGPLLKGVFSHRPFPDAACQGKVDALAQVFNRLDRVPGIMLWTEITGPGSFDEALFYNQKENPHGA